MRAPLRYRLLLVVLLLLLTSGLRLHHSGTLGTQSDEGIHVTVAERLATGNDKIYRDLFENRTPGVEWFVAALFTLTGPSVFAARILSIGVATVTVAGVLLATREIVLAGGAMDKSIAPLAGGLSAATLFALAPLPLFWARYTMMEHYATAAATLSVALMALASRRRRAIYWLEAGLLAALAILFKQTELILLAAAGVFFGAQFLSQHRQRLRLALVPWMAGLAAGLGAFLLLLLVHGTAADFVQMVSGAERLAPLANLEAKGQTLWQWASRRPHAALALPGLLLLLWRRSPQLLLAAVWAGAALLALLLPPELDLSPGGFSHYIVTPVAALSILGGATVGLLMQGWHGNRYTKLVSVAGAVLLLSSTPGWLQDLQRAVQEREYPQPDFTAEQRIGHATALLSADREAAPILVLGNASIYHWAKRSPASRFFHLPAYFSDAPVGRRAFNEWTALLNEREMSAVVISRLHLQERLPHDVQAALWTNWTPVALFPYPYQRDVILFRPLPTIDSGQPLAHFDSDIRLIDTHSQLLDENTFLLKLVWQSLSQPQDDYTVFVHVVDAGGQLVAQADSVPAVGFRPTSTWQPQEMIVDYHWITLPENVNATTSTISIGLYHQANNERLPVIGLQPDQTVRDQSLIQPLQP
ncbi:MAG: ArnT family glycosyltransferase [Chloroflexota bacterium]